MDLRQNSIIESIGVYLPPQSSLTAEVISGCANPLQFPLEKITGIQSRRIAGDIEFSIDLASKSIIDCLSKSEFGPADIDLLVCCNISRYDSHGKISFEPNTSVRLRKQFGFINALVFDITNACAGMFTGIYLVNALIRSGAIRRGMVVSGEYITHLTKTAQKEIENFMDKRLACLTLGDAGAALILQKAPRSETGFQEFDLQTLGRYSPLCTAKASDQNGMIMYTDSVSLTDVAVKSGAYHALKMLEHAEWPPDSFQHLIMHQTSKTTLNAAKREINRLFKREICHDGNSINNLAERGNTASTSHVVALADHIRNNNINAGDKIIFSITASGLTIGTALYIFDDLPDRFRNLEMQGSVVKKKESSLQTQPVESNLHRRVRIESFGTLPAARFAKSNSMELLKAAATCCLDSSSYECSEIQLLMYTGIYRSDFLMEPAYAAMLAGELKMNDVLAAGSHNKTLAFDLFNSSVGFLNACYVAQQMITAQNCNTAMIVAAEIENDGPFDSDKKLGIGETASAAIMDSPVIGYEGFSHFLFKFYPESMDACTTYCSVGDGKAHLYIEKDAELEALYISCILPAVQELLEMEGLDLQRVTKVLPPQISSRFIARLSETLNLPLEKFVDVVGEGPDLFSSSLVYAFQHAREKGLVQTGDIGLIIAVGSGIQVGCTIYYF